MSEKDASWHGIKTDILRITYYIFSILIPKSVLFCFCAWDNIQLKEPIKTFDQNFKVKLAVI